MPLTDDETPSLSDDNEKPEAESQPPHNPLYNTSSDEGQEGDSLDNVIRGASQLDSFTRHHPRTSPSPLRISASSIIPERAHFQPDTPGYLQSEAAESMTFSDAEEDQPTMRSNNHNVPSEAPNSTPASEGSSSSSQQPSNDVTNSGVESDASSMNAPSAGVSGGASASSPENGSSSTSEQAAETHSVNPEEASHESENVQDSSGGANDSTASLSLGNNSMKGLSAANIADKLQQVQDYIQQTTTAMQALENEGDMNKIQHYNTLAKVLRDLRASEQNLETHLAKAKEKELNIKSKGSGSEAIGVVGNLSESTQRPSMQERLARHTTEAGELTDRLRDSVARREELMVRYRATRERLNNLKQQRRGIVAEERRILTDQGAPSSPYEDAIPGAETWTAEQLRSSIEDFQGLWNKVERLERTYSARMAIVDSDDPRTTADMEGKLQQLASKKRQLDDILQQLNRHLQVREREGPRPEDQPPIAPSAMDPELPTIGSTTAEDAVQPASEQVAEVDFASSSNLQAAASDVNNMSADLTSRKEELIQLQEQLSSMKQLLTETQSMNRANRNQARHQRAPPQEETIQVKVAETFDEGAIGGTITGINGTVIHLSEAERQDPEVIVKFQQLSAAKRRLAKMEDIMKGITEAQMSGKPLQEVLTPECLEILNEAKEEYEEPLTSERGTGSASLRGQNDTRLPSNDIFNQQTGVYSLRQEDNGSLHERDTNAMQSHLNKTDVPPHPANNGSRNQKEKSPSHKHTRNLWRGGEPSNKTGDPRLNEVLTLHEELKEKKNALEALTKRMGKASSYAMDNLSDNLSDNILENNSDTDKQAPGWAAAGSHRPSAATLDHSNDYISGDELAEEYQSALPNMRNQPRKDPYLERNKFNPDLQPQDIRRNSNQGRVSVNNLCGSLPRSVRPKPNRSRGNMPKAPWGATDQEASFPNQSTKQNSAFVSQNTISYTLNQLSSVQETINSLYKNLQQTESISQQPLQSSAPQYNPLPLYGLAPFNSFNFSSPYAGFNMSEQARHDQQSNQLLAGLHQCFSQLYLQSLEIQSMAKQIQLLEQKERSPSPQRQNSSFENRNSRPLLVPKRESQDKTIPSAPPPRLPSSSPLRTMHFHVGQPPPQHVISPQTNQGAPLGYTFPQNPTSKIPYERFPAVARHFQPFQVPDKGSCSRIIDPSSLGPLRGSSIEEADPFVNQNFYPPFDGTSVNEPNQRPEETFMSAACCPVLEEEDISQNPMWGDVSSQQLTCDASSDILNNQVPPGSRANNYWDNFRSYSRQNPLSTSSKRNTGDRIHASALMSGNDQEPCLPNSNIPMQLSASSLNTKREFNPTCNPPNNFINKASEKNIASRRLNLGARPKYPQQSSYKFFPWDARGTHSTNILPPSYGHQGEMYKKRSQKRNNRQNEGSFSLPHLEREQFSTASLNNRSEVFNASSPGDKRSLPQRFPYDDNVWGYPTSPSSLPIVGDAFEELQKCLNTLSRSSSPTYTGEASNPTNVNHIDNLTGFPTKTDAQSQMRKEAESLMKKYSKKPEYLLHLFKHISRISNNADQQVALELLNELSNQQNNLREMPVNRHGSFHISANSDASHFSPSLDLSPRNQRNMHKSSLLKAGALGGSEASESGLTSEDDETKAFYRMFKNLTPSSSTDHISSALQNCYGEQQFLISSGYDSCNGPMTTQNRTQEIREPSGLPKSSSKDAANGVYAHLDPDKSMHPDQHSRLERNFSASMAHSIPFGSSNGQFGYSIPHEIPCQSNLESASKSTSFPKNKQPASKLQAKHHSKDYNFQQPEAFMAEKMPSKNLNALLRNLPDDYSSQGFKTFASACLREVLRSFEWLRRLPISPPDYLAQLHPAIMRQVEKHSTWMGESSDFVASFDCHLKEVLEGFSTKQLPEIVQELSTAVTQVVINQYCSHLPNDIADNVQRDGFLPNENQNHNLLYDLRPNPPSAQDRSMSSFMDELNFHITTPCPPRTIGFESNSAGATIQNNVVSSSYKEHKNSASGGLPKNSDPNQPKQSTKIMSKTLDSIWKSNSHSLNNETMPLFLSNEVNGIKESPLSESSFPESWIIPPHLNASNGLEAVPAETTERHAAKKVNTSEPNEFFIRGSCDLNAKDAEADQRKYSLAKEFHNTAVLVHDLAEADQSRDTLEMNGVSLESISQVESLGTSFMNSHIDASFLPDEGAVGGGSDSAPPVAYPAKTTLPQEKDQHKRNFTQTIPNHKGNSEQGLDEVPTKLMSPGQGSPLQLSNTEEGSSKNHCSSFRRFERIHSNETGCGNQEQSLPSERQFAPVVANGEIETNSLLNNSQSREANSAAMSDKSA